VGSFLLEIIKVFVLALVIIVPIRVFLFQPFFVQGASMEPNFDDGDYLIINELGYKKTDVQFGNVNFFTVDSFKSLHRGDVIVFRYPQDPQKYFIKRAIGLPGEKIEIRQGKVIIYNHEYPDGFVLDENNYLSKDLETNGELIEQIGEDKYFVMGDNRTASSDSRSWGLLDKDKIVGKVLVRAWPVNNAEIY
jgi:signal peptidase I